MLPNERDRGLVLLNERDRGVGGWCYPIKETGGDGGWCYPIKETGGCWLVLPNKGDRGLGVGVTQ